MKMKTLLAVACALSMCTLAGAQTNQRPLLTLTANNASTVEVPRGWPLLISGTVFHSERLNKSANVPLLRIAPIGMSWAESIRLVVTAEDGTERHWAFKLDGRPDQPELHLPHRSFVKAAWYLSPDDTAALATGRYRLHAGLSLSGTAGWNGTVQSAAVTIHIVDEPQTLDEAGAANKAVLRATFELSQQRPAQAAAIIESLLAQYPKNTRGLLLKSRILESLDQLADAWLAARQAVRASSEKNWDPQEPPFTLFDRERELFKKLSGSGDQSFSISNFGSMSLQSDGGSAAIEVGYGRIAPDTGSTAPNGIAIFGLRQNNVLVNEVGVPASPAILSGRIFAEVGSGGLVNTGLAIANPNAQPATINFYFTDSTGVDFSSGVATIPANGQLARFLSEMPYNGGTNIQGTFTFSSNVPVSVIALRGLTNERNEFVLTTLPVAGLASGPLTGTQVLAHWADGGGNVTQVILVNPSDNSMTGEIQFYNPGSGATPGGLVQAVAYSIARRGAYKFSTPNTASAISTGSVRVVPAAGQSAPVALSLFSIQSNGITISEAAAPAMQGAAFRLYAESSGVPGSSGNIQTGLALAHTAPVSADVRLEVFRLDGVSTGLAATVTLPPSGQLARFLGEIFPALPMPFQGIVRITTTSPSGISVAGLRGRYNERRDFLITTTPPSLETASPSARESFFAHIVNGGGYTTQLILFGGSNLASSGNLRFLRKDGLGLNLILR